MSWYAEWFDEEYVRVYGHRDEGQARRDAAFAIEALRLQSDQLILDLGCGNGRHLAALCEEGFCRLVGVDLSAPLLKLARESFDSSCEFGAVVQADMRRLPFQNSFDVVMNMFTSFGYFEKDEENLLVLENIRIALKEGGRFILDYLNPEHVTRHLEPYSERRIGNRRVIEKRFIDQENKRVNKNIEIQTPDGSKPYQESVRLYSHAEMLEMFGAAGLEVKQTFGNFDFEPFEPLAPRMIFVGEAPSPRPLSAKQED